MASVIQILFLDRVHAHSYYHTRAHTHVDTGTHHACYISADIWNPFFLWRSDLFYANTSTLHVFDIGALSLSVARFPQIVKCISHVVLFCRFMYIRSTVVFCIWSSELDWKLYDASIKLISVHNRLDENVLKVWRNPGYIYFVFLIQMAHRVT